MARKKIIIKLADNGIIIREPVSSVEIVRLSLYQKNSVEEFSQPYHDLGRTLFDWLLDAVLEDYDGPLVPEGFNIEINAEIKGRKRN